jgi:hypothetical protein
VPRDRHGHGRNGLFFHGGGDDGIRLAFEGNRGVRDLRRARRCNEPERDERDEQREQEEDATGHAGMV